MEKNKNFRINNLKSFKLKILSILLPLIIIGQVSVGSVAIRSVKNFGNSILQKDLTNGQNSSLRSLDDYFWGIEYRMDTMGKTGIFQSDMEKNDFTSSIKMLEGLKGANDVITSTVYRAGDTNLIVPSIDYKSKGQEAVITDDVYKDALNQETLWVGPYEDKLSGNTTLSVYKQVKTGDTVVGIIGMNINFDDISSYLSERVFSKTGYSILLTNDGTILSNKADMSTVHKKTDNKEFLSAIGISGKSEGETEISGDSYLYEADDVPRTTWKVISVIDKDEHQEELRAVIIKQSVILAIVILISIVLVSYVADYVSKRLKNIMQAMDKAGNGDLTSKVESIENNDELGAIAHSYNKMIDDFSVMIKDTKNSINMLNEKNDLLNESFGELKDHSNQISSTMMQIASVSNEQAKGSDLVVRETENLSDIIEEVSHSLSDMELSCESLEKISKSGIDTINKLVEGSRNTVKATEEINDSVNNVSESSKEIENIIVLINEISEQTNLLALNAAIEAARVGEKGKGFAVVAEEIGKLAEESKKSTNNIQKIISTMQEKITDTVENINNVNNVISNQNDNVKNTEGSFTDIFEKVLNLNDSVRVISELNNKMVSKKDVISESMQNLAAGIEETSASTEEITSYTESQLVITDKADNLSKEIVEVNEKLVEKLAQFKDK